MAWGRPAMPSVPRKGPTRVGDWICTVAAAGPPASQGSPQAVTSTPSKRLCPLPWEGAKLLLLSLGSPRRFSWATPSPQRTWMQRRRQCCSGSTVSWRIRLVRVGWECGVVGSRLVWGCSWCLLAEEISYFVVLGEVAQGCRVSVQFLCLLGSSAKGLFLTASCRS